MGKEGKLIIFAAPSGCGKTSIVQAVKDWTPDTFEFSVSATNREKRKNEINGKDYLFLNSVDDFKAKIANNEFVEWEEVYKDNFYGTLFSEVDRIIHSGKAGLFDIDVKGAFNLKKKYGKKALFVYVHVPKKIAEERLQKRATENGKSYQERIGKYEEEAEYQQYSDVILDNSLELATSVKSIKRMITRFLNN